MCSHGQVVYLTMTGREYLEHINTAIARFDMVYVGAAVIRNIEAGSKPEILLVRRPLDAEYFPGIFEIPSGKVEETGAFLEGALMRVVLETCNLQVSNVLHTLPDITYDVEEKVTNPDGTEETIKHPVIQLNYVVEVKDDEDLRCNPATYIQPSWYNDTMLEVSPLISFYSMSHELPAPISHRFIWLGLSRGRQELL